MEVTGELSEASELSEEYFELAENFKIKLNLPIEIDFVPDCIVHCMICHIDNRRSYALNMLDFLLMVSESESFSEKKHEIHLSEGALIDRQANLTGSKRLYWFLRKCEDPTEIEFEETRRALLKLYNTHVPDIMLGCV